MSHVNEYYLKTMSHKRFQKNYVCQLLLLSFIFWAVCGQGLHLWKLSHFHSVNILQNNIVAQIAVSSETHDGEHCSICLFYQLLQHSFFVPNALLNEIVLLKQQLFSEDRFSVGDGVAGLFLRGPPFSH
ncbi:MAG: hypothetical protein LBJ67_10320 [Planctomycetaceae bacterium]|jgi:hypothetical protein|nr:hypothetical protein [Planctomycetaceae bacterium]